MNKIALLVFTVIFSLCLFGCSKTDTAQTGNSVSETESSDFFSQTVITEEASAEESESTAEPSSEAETSSEYVSETVSSETTLPSETAVSEETSSAESEEYEEVDLSIDMPEPNGTMLVSSERENKYIETVVSERGIDPSLLVAVFSVPESGQNYVFEFYSAGERTAENIRRVFFINSNGIIESVTASKATERENVSATENWFSMNVLIKQLIFPAVKDQM